MSLAFHTKITMREGIIIPVIDLGATHTRRGFVAFQLEKGKIAGQPVFLYPRKPKKLKNPVKFDPNRPRGEVTDLKATLKKTVRDLRILIQRVQKQFSYPLLKTAGICAPGAWLDEGIPYQGTVPNLPDLEDFKLAHEVSRMMGEGWDAVVNNDGVANVLSITHHLLLHIEKFPMIQRHLKENGKIVGFIPGTGFGAGGFKVKDGRIVPFRGPQQFFDIILGPGEGRIIPGFITPEDLITGDGIRFQAERNSLLREKFPAAKLSGEFLGALTEHKEENIKEAAQSLYRRAGEALAQTMILIHRGGVKGESRKAVVKNPPRLETKFWREVKGTKIFILGGWLLSRTGCDFVLPAMEKELKNKGYSFALIRADEVPGVRELLKKDSAGLVGASLLVLSHTKTIHTRHWLT